jgi:hypothetical protein
VKTTIRKTGIRLVQLLILTIPLEISKLWFPFLLLEKPIDGRPVSIIDLSRITLCLLCLFYVAAFFFDKKARTVPLRYFSSPFLLLATYMLSLLTSPTPFVALNEIVRLVFHLFMAFFVVWVVRNEEDARTIIATYRFTALYLALMVVFQLLTGIVFWNPQIGALGTRYNATMADVNNLTRYLVIGFFAWLFAPKTKNLVNQFIRLSSLFLCLFTILITYSRGSWVAFAVLLLYSIVVSPLRETSSSRIMLLLCGFFAFLVIALSPILQERLHSFEQGLNALDARVDFIRAGMAMFLDHFFFGVGLGAYPFEYAQNYSEFFSYYGEVGIVSHTALVTTAAELGIVGLIITFLFLLRSYAMYQFVMKKRQVGHKKDMLELCVPFIAMLTILICSQAEGRFWEDPYLWIFWGTLVAIHKDKRFALSEKTVTYATNQPLLSF